MCRQLSKQSQTFRRLVLALRQHSVRVQDPNVDLDQSGAELAKASIKMPQSHSGKRRRQPNAAERLRKWRALKPRHLTLGAPPSSLLWITSFAPPVSTNGRKDDLASRSGRPRPDLSSHARMSWWEMLIGVILCELIICTTPDDGSGAPGMKTATWPSLNASTTNPICQPLGTRTRTGLRSSLVSIPANRSACLRTAA
jgi:hypothetical protein